MTNYEQSAKDILQWCGGTDNVAGVSHCATRLRIAVNSGAKVNKEELEKVPGVMGIVERDTEYQLVIGTDVSKMYGEFVKLGNFKKKGAVDEKGKKSIFGTVIDFVSGTFMAMLPILVAAGLVSAVLTIGTNFFGMSTESGTYVVLSAINQAGFYFLPVYLGFSAARKLNINPFLGAYLGCILVFSSINGASGLSFLGIPIATVTYSQSVIPIILGVLFMSVIDKLLDFIPKEIRYFAKPLLLMLIVTPVTLWVLGPIGTWLAEGLAVVLSLINQYLGFVSVSIIGALTPFLVMTGTNQALFPPCLAAVAEFGYDPFVLPGMLAANTAVGAAALAVWLKSKNKDVKATGISTGLTGVLGITEPAIFGILLRLKRPFWGAVAGGAAGGLFAGIVGLKQYAVASPGLASLPTFIPPDGNLMNFWMAIVTVIIACAVSFTVTWVLGFEDPAQDDAKKSA